MKKITNLLILTALLGIMTECKKGEDDPLISFRSRKARVIGDWKLTSGTRMYTSSYSSGSSSQSDSDTFTYTETAYTYNGSSTSNGSTNTYNSAGVYSYLIEFKKDGTYSMTENTDGSVTLESGVWNFTGKVGDYKNKEQIALTQRMRTTGSGTSIYTGKEPDNTLTIKELRNKKMVIAWDDTGNFNSTSGSFSSNSTSTDKGESTFEQK